jgi:hypothetical protein
MESLLVVSVDTGLENRRAGNRPGEFESLPNRL